MSTSQTHELRILALPTSPFAARLHVQLLEKGLSWEFVYPDAGTSRSEHSALNPFLKTPILVNGPHYLIESAAIAEYLEDLHPTPSLRGSTPWVTAQMRAFIAALDQYLFAQLFRLRALPVGDAAVAAVMADMHQVLDRLERLCGSEAYLCGDSLTLADCALLPACFYLDLFFARHQQPDLRLSHPRLAQWWTVVGQHESVRTILAHMRAALPPAA